MKVARGSLVALVLALGCARTPPPIVGLSPIARPTPTTPPPPRGKGLRSALLSSLAPGFQGPYVAAAGEHAIAVWGAEGGPWQIAPVSAEGTPGAPRAGATVPKGLGLIALRALDGGGFVMVTARSVDRGFSLEAQAIDDDGGLRGAATTIYQGAAAVTWADATPVPGGALVMFATTSSHGAPELAVTPIDPRGALRGATMPLGPTATSWQVVPTAKGALVAVLTGRSGVVSTIAVDAMGKSAPPVTLAGTHAESDLDAVRVGDRVLLAWTDRGRGEGRVVVTSVDASGAVLVPPRTPVVSAGEQALVLLAASGGTPLLAWDDAAARIPGGRRLQLATLPADLSAPIAQATLDVGVRDDTPPLVVGAPDGFALLTVATACDASAATCKPAPVLPSFARLGLDLAPLAWGPLAIDLEDGAPPELAWGLSCVARGCFVVATGDRQPASAYVVAVDASPSAVRPFVRARPATPPIALAIDAVAKGPRLAAMGATALEKGALVATVTDFGDGAALPPLPPDVDARGELEKDRLAAKDAKRSKRAAIVRVTAISADGQPAGDATISVRALSAGGVAIAPDRAGKEACVAWVARDEGDPEVFLTRVGPDGKKRGQTMLTHAKGDVGDMALAPLDDGWLVAWVDGRDGNGEVYAARVDKALRKVGPEQRITNAPGDASDVALLVREKDALVAFSDARGAAGKAGDAFVAKVRLTDAAKIGEELRLAQTPEHARAVRLVQVGTEVAVVFLEQPVGVAAAAAEGRTTALVVWLDANGAPRGLPETLSLGDVSPTSLAIGCAAGGCRVAVTHGEGEALALSVAPWAKGAPTSARDVVTLLARAGADAWPAIVGDAIYVLDDGPPGEGRARRVSIRWP